MTNPNPAPRGAMIVTTALAAMIALAGPAIAHGEAEVDLGECGWVLRADPEIVNVFYPDEAADYWAYPYTAVPGTKVVIRGEFPLARYMSFNTYDNFFRPLDAIADVEISPATGVNPFAPGASRALAGNTYEVTVKFGPKPASPEPNTIYAGAGQNENDPPNPTGLLLYRIYMVDDPNDTHGGVGLPTVSVVVEDAEEGEIVLDQDDACAQFRELPKPPIEEIYNDTHVPNELRPLLPGWPGTTPPTFHVFRAFNAVAAQLLFENEALRPAGGPGIAAQVQPQGSGGFLNNVHNHYFYAISSAAHGEVLVIRGKAPTFADTRGRTTMPADPVDVRYWSVCSGIVTTTRTVDCRNDEDMRLEPDGTFTIVLSSPGNRPANVRNWLRFGGGIDGGPIYRQMLADDGFVESIRASVEAGRTETEMMTVMGDYFPRGKYCSKAEFEADYGCGLP